MSGNANSIKSILYALTANFFIALAKTVAAVVTGSGSMFAEAIHSFADCTNQALLLLGLKRAKRPPSSEFPLGYGKEIYFWSFIVALILFSIGGLVSLYEGFHKLNHPQALEVPYVALGVLIFAILAEGGSLWGCIVEINKVRGQQSLWRWFRNSRQSELIVIFGEDIAALLGLIVATLAIILTIITNNPVYDALGTLTIGFLLILISFLIGQQVKDLLVGQGVEPEVKVSMESFLQQRPEIDRLFNLVTLQMGNDVMVAVKAKMTTPIDTAELLANINRCEAAFSQAFPQVMWLFFEPDISDE